MALGPRNQTANLIQIYADTRSYSVKHLVIKCMSSGRNKVIRPSHVSMNHENGSISFCASSIYLCQNGKKSNIDWTLLILPAPNYLTSNAHQYSEQ